jgi:UDP-N-acetylglucosamine acyltransferase
MIHSTAIVDAKAEIDPSVEVGPYSIIRGKVSIGPGTVIGSHVIIDSFVTIGPDCRIYSYASIGADPQALKFKGEETYAMIGRGTIVREFVTINRGTEFGGGITEVGEENFLMAYTHIAHDCKTGKGCILANGATLAGHVTLLDYVSIGGLVAIHQFVRIGQYAYVGGTSAVVKDIPPYVIAAGDRATLHGLNKVGLSRHGFSEETLHSLKKAYRILFREGLTVSEATEKIAAEVEQIPEVVNLVNFISSSKRGITR